VNTGTISGEAKLKTAASFPLFKVTMILTALITATTLHLIAPAPSADSSPVQVAMLQSDLPVPTRPAMSALELRKAKRISNMHSAALKSSFVKSSVPSVIPSESPTGRRFDNQRGVYLTASSVARTKFFDDTIDDLLEAGGSTIIFDVKGGGVLFHSAAPLANEVGLVKNIYDLPAIIQKLHEKNIYVMGRFVAIKDDAFTTKRPDTRIKNPKTGKVLSQTWVDPANDDAIRFNMEVMCELAAAGIDEINLDYIRFSTADFGALGVYSGDEKADRVEKFLKASRETINRCGPTTKLGISTFAILGWAYDINMETLGQDVKRFAPLVDVISPMAYPATFAEGHYYNPAKHPRSRMYYLVYRTMTGYAEFLGPDHAHKLRPWIQGYGVTTKNVKDEIDAVYDAGACGFTVWNANNNYAPTYAAITSDTARPERCLD
jgi:hypothetical protein